MISFGLIDEHPVFMDEGTDSYFMLERSDERHFLQVLGAGRCIEGDVQLDEAFGTGAAIVRTQCVSATRSLLEESRRARIGAIDILKGTSAICATKRLLAKKSIQWILSDLQESGRKGVPSIRPMSERALAFAELRKFVPVAPNCLLDSLALLRWLGPARTSAMLVFGAKLDPFGAHCWVQSDELLLNDRLENVARFCPVRVVRCLRATL